MKKHGKKDRLDFNDKERQELRKFFNSLDEDGSGAIGIEELEDPLIALGLADSRSQVQEMVSLVDRDGSNHIEFNEFLEIIKSGNAISNNLAQFFKSLVQGSLIQDATDLPFKLLVSAFRRKMLIAAMTAENQEIKERGERVMKAYQKQLALTKNRTTRNSDISLTSLNKKKSQQSINSQTQKQQKQSGFYDLIDQNSPYMPNERNGFPKLPKVMVQQEEVKEELKNIQKKKRQNTFKGILTGRKSSQV